MTKTPKYPIGIQAFSDIIEEGYTYVDKTEYVAKLVNGGKFFFLSRPRRFGKSLLVSTLHAYFEGRRDLFKGLALDSEDVEWEPSPVLHFDFNAEDFHREDGLEQLLYNQLGEYEKKYEINQIAITPAQRLRSLISTVFEKTGRKVVVLIDEYDKPLLNLEEHKELFEKNQRILKGFFGNLKTLSSCLRFAFLTGVARFNKVSIFSDLNNLYDISLSEEYADICGWTEKELVSNFKEGITSMAERRNKDFDVMLADLREFYDGYKFSETGSRLYNPFSVLLALSEKKISPHWFHTGTPTFLAQRVRNRRIQLDKLNDQWASEWDLLEVGLNADNPVPLMFQTGYLTIDHYDERRQRYNLRFPNREVEIGFARYLYPLYVKNGDWNNSPFSWANFQDYLLDGEPENFMLSLQTLLKGMPYEDQSENVYRSIVWLLGTLCSTDTEAERHSYKGRSDLEIKTDEYIYVFEFKFNRSVEEAMIQLRERDYAGRYALDNRKVYLIAANFSDSTPTPGLTAFEIQPLS